MCNMVMSLAIQHINTFFCSFFYSLNTWLHRFISLLSLKFWATNATALLVLSNSFQWLLINIQLFSKSLWTLFLFCSILRVKSISILHHPIFIFSSLYLNFLYLLVSLLYWAFRIIWTTFYPFYEILFSCLLDQRDNSFAKLI